MIHSLRDQTPPLCSLLFPGLLKLCDPVGSPDWYEPSRSARSPFRLSEDSGEASLDGSSGGTVG